MTVVAVVAEGEVGRIEDLAVEADDIVAGLSWHYGFVVEIRVAKVRERGTVHN